ncbi:hypothetical protein MIMGU_mgv1a019847mg, partial [Erythranthe guttata]
RIPPAFLEHMEEKLSSVATLTTSRGRKWRVRLVEEEDSMVLKDGWEKFYEDNNLKITDVLLFTYHGNLRFNVGIYDQDGTIIN